MHVRARLAAGIVMVSLLLSGSATVSGADRDRDGLADAFELRGGVTDPDVRDTDGDGVVDSAEDNDHDGLGNLGEQRFGTDPGRRDSDGDGIRDGLDDSDRDGRPDGREQDRRRVPTGLQPTLRGARGSFPPIRFDCQTPQRQSRPVVCSFGPADADVEIVITGDSHAMMWTSPIRHIAEARGWRFTTMTKTGCAPILGINTPGQLEIDGGTSCAAWRHKVIARLVAHPPDLIVVTHSDRYPLYRASGQPVPKARWPLTWRRALERTLDAFPPASEVLVLGDVPHNDLNPRRCLLRNQDDMSACVSRRVALTARPVERALRQAAAARGATFRTLYGKVCSYDPCPLVQGHVLMWRNKGHITDRFANQLQPSMRALLMRVLR